MASADPNGSSMSPSQQQQQQSAAFNLPSVAGGLDIDSMTPAGSSAFPQQQGNPMGAGVVNNPTTNGGVVMGGAGDLRSTSAPTSSSSAAMMAPKFPPTNFEVPDINFSNSLSGNVDFGPSFFAAPASATTAAMFQQQQHGVLTNTHPMASMTNTSTALPPGIMMQQQQQQQAGYGNVPGFGTNTPAGMGSVRPSGPAVTAATMGPGMGMGPGGGGTPANACTSPPGTSSSEDSDDLPLAQIASMKRAANAAIGNNPAPAPTSSSSTDTAAGSTTETASVESSPTPGKKPKVSKRKKKKDPNEPTKPVSAYALFFRDTQATIKNHNPSASFGEVSKIVASMWDQLDPEHKDVYKKKTEMAKKLYLKQLAAYRASQVSQSTADDTEKSPSPPGMPMASPNMVTNPGMVHSTGGQGVPVMSPSHMAGGPMMHPHPHHHMPPHMMPPPQQPQQHPQQQQQQPQQQQFFHPQDPLLQQQQQHQQQQQQQQHHHHHQQMIQHDPQQQQQQMDNRTADVNYTPCTRNGCINQAQENPAWDSEFCSHDCVITHCRDIFTNWVGARSGSSTFPVK